MRIICILLLFLIEFNVRAQETKTIYANDKQVVGLFFPNEIRQAVVGSSNFTFSYNKENPQRVGLLQGIKGNESNLLVITATDEVFSYLLSYREELDTLNYFIVSKERKGLEKSVNRFAFKNILPAKMDTIIKPSKTHFKNRVEYFKKFSEYHLKHNQNSLKKKRKKGLKLHLKDLIYDRTEVYALIEIKNRSRIDFEVDYLRIFKVNGNNKRKSSYQKVPLAPVYTSRFPKMIKVGESQRFVLVVPKFTLGDAEKLLLEFKEFRGSRILQLDHE